MVTVDKIPYNEKLYSPGIDRYGSNMSDMLRKFRDRDIPVFLSELVSNV